MMFPALNYDSLMCLFYVLLPITVITVTDVQIVPHVANRNLQVDP